MSKTVLRLSLSSSSQCLLTRKYNVLADCTCLTVLLQHVEVSAPSTEVSTESTDHQALWSDGHHFFPYHHVARTTKPQIPQYPDTQSLSKAVTVPERAKLGPRRWHGSPLY